ncbi:MAG TPA: ATP-binding protein [Solirubrobacteraceae bacterium]|jgi:anti-sigma regulatory factor (Ser/Thr protein kinase)|nr:ATP-binding protein [Solirubrobacteraceae bacterium]
MRVPFEAKMPGTPLGVRMLRREVSVIATDCGMDEAGVADVQLAVTEAATNAVMHGYSEATGELTVSAVVEDGELAIVIGDTGRGFDDRRESPGLGVGLSIIASVAERLRIIATPGGTEIHMAFPCPNAH